MRELRALEGDLLSIGQIIGIVGDTRDDDLSHAPEPTMIIPDAQELNQMVELETQFGPMW